MASYGTGYVFDSVIVGKTGPRYLDLSAGDIRIWTGTEWEPQRIRTLSVTDWDRPQNKKY